MREPLMKRSLGRPDGAPAETVKDVALNFVRTNARVWAGLRFGPYPLNIAMISEGLLALRRTTDADTFKRNVETLCAEVDALVSGEGAADK